MQPTPPNTVAVLLTETSRGVQLWLIAMVLSTASAYLNDRDRLVQITLP